MNLDFNFENIWNVSFTWIRMQQEMEKGLNGHAFFVKSVYNFYLFKSLKLLVLEMKFGSKWSILTSERNPKTYENVNRLVGDDARDLLLFQEGRGFVVGGCEQTNNDVPVNSVKEIRQFWSL